GGIRRQGARRIRPLSPKAAIGTGLRDFGHFWPEVPETPHIGAHPGISAAVSADRATRKSPANRLVLVL
ncbi:MAG TPA: hypothetical protein VIY71_09750, partial [Solirubrobacterales bacterium]